MSAGENPHIPNIWARNPKQLASDVIVHAGSSLVTV